MAKKAKTTARRTWSKDDLRTLKTMARTKVGTLKISKRL
jgi:hypothetical protein